MERPIWTKASGVVPSVKAIPILKTAPSQALSYKWDPRKGLTLRASLIANANPNSTFPLASRVVVKNLGYSITESCLHQQFSNFGQVAQVNLIKNESAKGSNAFAFIQYTSQDDAILALENMDHTVFEGRLIYVEIAKPGRGHFGGYPKASGPPRKQHFQLQPQDEVADCWY